MNFLKDVIIEDEHFNKATFRFKGNYGAKAGFINYKVTCINFVGKTDLTVKEGNGVRDYVPGSDPPLTFNKEHVLDILKDKIYAEDIGQPKPKDFKTWWDGAATSPFFDTDREERSKHKLWDPAQAPSNMSTIVSGNSTDRSYKYGREFTADFFKDAFKDKPNIKVEAGDGAAYFQWSVESSKFQDKPRPHFPTDAGAKCKSLTFEFPIAIDFNSGDGQLGQLDLEKIYTKVDVVTPTTAVAELGTQIDAISMALFLASDPVVKKLSADHLQLVDPNNPPQSKEFNEEVLKSPPDIVAKYAFGDPEIYDGIAAYVPYMFVGIGDQEKFDALIAAALNASISDGAGTGLTEAQKKSRLPLNEQAILLYRLGSLLESNRKKRNKDEYDRFSTLEVKKAKEIEVLVNYLTLPENVSSVFEKIRPIHLSAIIPRVRLYKKYPFNAKRLAAGKGKKDKEPVYIEYEFEEHIRPDMLSSTLTTNTGVGLESFSWSFDGENPVAAVKQISAQLKMRAQSVNVLEELRVSSNSSNSNFRTYAFSDIWIPESRRKENNGVRSNASDDAQKKNYEQRKIESAETRIEIEYGIDPSNQIFKTQDGKEIAKTLKSLRLVINLSIAKYEIDLRDDGSVGITCDFIGRLDALAKDPSAGNILPNQEFTNEQKSAFLGERLSAGTTVSTIQQRLIKMEKKEMEFLQQQHRNPHRYSAETIAERKEGYHKMKKELEKQKKRLTNTFDLNTGTSASAQNAYLKEMAANEFSKIKLYRTILNGLLEKDCVNTIVIDPSNIALTHEELKTKSNALQIVHNQEMTNEEKAFTYRNEKGVPASKQELVNEFDILSKRLKKDIFPKYTSDAYLIRFFYFGDLIDVVLDNMYEGSGRDRSLDIRTILGPIEIRRNVFDSSKFEGVIQFLRSGAIVVGDNYGTYDPTATRETKAAIDQIDNKSTSNNANPTKDDQTLIASLADIPISLNLFLRWFSEIVSNKGIFGKSFKNFLTEATNQLIVAALQQESSRLLLPKQVRKVKTVNWESHTKPNMADPFGFINKKDKGLKIEGKNAQRIKKSKKGTHLEQLRADIIKNIAHAGGANTSEYVLIYAESKQSTRKYNGSPDQYAADLDDNVYHLSLGRDVGVVKDIKLSAPTSAEFEAMQLQKASKTDGTIKTKRIYNATVTLYGVTFFRPGQMIFIEPAAYGDLDNLKAHGLCGYYTITSISSNFTVGNFETTLVCSWFSEG